MKQYIFLFVLLSFSMIFSFSQDSLNRDTIVDYTLAVRYFHDAEKASNISGNQGELKQDRLNIAALEKFNAFIAHHRNNFPDLFLFDSYLKAGLIEHYFDSLSLAQICYSNAIHLKWLIPPSQDSLLFKPYLFSGSIFYTHHEYDSAEHYYQLADEITSHYQVPLEESERLYNQMGALFFETGVYSLSKNYFEKALAILSPLNPSYSDLRVNYQMNIAAILVKEESFDSASRLYQIISSQNIHLNEIYHNLGIISSNKGRYAQAINYFRKVNYSNSSRVIDLDYNFALCFSKLAAYDSSRSYLAKGFQNNLIWNGHRKNVSLGLLYHLAADDHLFRRDWKASAALYQQSIQQFYPAFNDSDIHRNPEIFTGIFSYAHLFKSLVSKAAVFEELNRQKPDSSLLRFALDSYRSAFKLSDYILTTYTSEESRMFLLKNTNDISDKVIQLCLELGKLTKKNKFEEEAFYFDQRNKAFLLTLSLQENKMHLLKAGNDTIVAKQYNLRREVTRLSLSAAFINDSNKISQLNAEIRDDEISLAALQSSLSRDLKYSRLLSATILPSLPEVQREIGRYSKLLSYHLSPNSLVIFCLGQQFYKHIEIPLDSSFYSALSALTTGLHRLDPSQRYPGSVTAMKLYNFLIRPLTPWLHDTRQLIIIPENELSYLPFEALEPSPGRYLVENFTTQYQYSAALLLQKSIKSNAAYTLAFAPYDVDTPSGDFSALPYSAQEVNAIKGKIYIGKEATKEKFLNLANKYDIIQLATHAVANDSAPGLSFIAFYPGSLVPVNQTRLYAPEIYNLRLDSVNLIFLSACETGGGKLIHGEGILSLSRAFSYAGCPNIITSLWKANDQTTAFISTRFHHYLQQGERIDKALQLSKLDLLQSPAISPALKTPDHWANLIFIGSSEQLINNNHPLCYMIVVLAFITSLLFFYFYRKNRRPSPGLR